MAAFLVVAAAVAVGDSAAVAAASVAVVPVEVAAAAVVEVAVEVAVEVSSIKGTNTCAVTLSTSELRKLEGAFAKFEQETTNQISVVLIPTLAGDSLEDYLTCLDRSYTSYY